MSLVLAEPLPLSPTERKAGILDQAFCIAVKLRCLGTKRTVSSEVVDTDADKALLHVTKDILDSPELTKVRKKHTEIRTYMRNVCLPSMFKEGVYLVSEKGLKVADQKLAEFMTKLELLH